MFAYLRFRWDCWRLQKQQRRAGKQHKVKIAAAKASGASADDIYEMEAEDAYDYFYFQDEIRVLTSRYLCSEASRLLLPIPDHGDEEMWHRLEPNRFCLNEKGINHMRSLLRAERKASVELFLMWVPGVVGILGTFIGLAAILRK